MSKTHYKNGMPKVWPWLTAEDMHKGAYDGPFGSHCLLGWADAICSRDAAVKVIDMLADEVGSVAYWNDERATKQQAADLWNRVGEKLGYTEWVK